MELLVVLNAIAFWLRPTWNGRSDLFNFPNFSVVPIFISSSELVDALWTLNVGKVSTDVSVVGEEGKDE